jgi:hypothetical protein
MDVHDVVTSGSVMISPVDLKRYSPGLASSIVDTSGGSHLVSPSQSPLQAIAAARCPFDQVVQVFIRIGQGDVFHQQPPLSLIDGCHLSMMLTCLPFTPRKPFAGTAIRLKNTVGTGLCHRHPDPAVVSLLKFKHYLRIFREHRISHGDLQSARKYALGCKVQ